MPVKHIRCELQGTLSNGAERWSCGFSTQPLEGSDPSAEDLALTALTTFLNQFWTAVAITAQLPNGTSLNSARVLKFDETGHVTETGESQLATPAFGDGGWSLPPQCSVVVSLRTPIPGARGRGRMYLPGFDVTSVTHFGRLDPTLRDAISLRMANFINTLDDDPTFPNVAVASGVGGFVTSVTSVQVGDVIDTQRRRRDQLPESYATNLVSP